MTLPDSILSVKIPPALTVGGAERDISTVSPVGTVVLGEPVPDEPEEPDGDGDAEGDGVEAGEGEIDGVGVDGESVVKGFVDGVKSGSEEGWPEGIDVIAGGIMVGTLVPGTFVTVEAGVGGIAGAGLEAGGLVSTAAPVAGAFDEAGVAVGVAGLREQAAKRVKKAAKTHNDSNNPCSFLDIPSSHAPGSSIDLITVHASK